MHYDPYVALLAARGELTTSDEDELESLYDSGNHVSRPPRENTDVMSGGSEADNRSFSDTMTLS